MNFGDMIFVCFSCQVLLATMEDQITRANRARIETIQKKQKIDQDFNNIKKTLKAAVSTG